MRPRARTPCVVAAAAIFGVALVPLFAHPAAGGPEPVAEGSTADNAQRKAAWAPDGALYVTYVQEQAGVAHVFVKVTRDAGASWTALPRLSQAEAFRPCVAVDSAGRLYVAWSEFVGSVRQVFTARWDGGQEWRDREQVSFTPGYSGFPALGVDAEDRVHLVWYGFDGETYRVHYRHRGAEGPWSDTTVVSGGVADANSPAVAVGPDGSVHVAFFASVRGTSEVWYLHGGPGGWDPPERVSAAGQQALRPSVAVFPAGAPAVAFVEAGGGAPQVVASERGPGGAWSPAQALSDPAEGGDNPSLALGADGEGAVFFEVPSGGLRVRALRGGQWEDLRPLGPPGAARWPSASWAMSPTNAAARPTFVVWTEGSAGADHRLAFAVTPAFAAAAPGPMGGAPAPLAPALAALALTGLLLAAAYAAARRPPAPREPPR